jgi:hypothetical protein
MSLLSRRQFVQASSLAALAAACPPLKAAESERYTNLVSPSKKLRIACVGGGGKATSDILGCQSEEIVAICDVDFSNALESFGRFPNALRYRDYRQMLNELRDQIDAVIVTTPDHTHFPAALMAVEMGKHIYVQKPLCHTINEVRALKAAVIKAKVVSQMGNQGHCNEGTRLLREWIDAGAIGQVTEIHSWSNRPIWPQGMPPAPEEPVVPSTMDWNLWLAVAPERGYSSKIAPFNWRGYWNYGCGALGDMACHQMDAPFWALNLRGNCTVTAESEGCSDLVCPSWSKIVYEFPQRGDLPPIKYYWYDGGKLPPTPPELGAGGKLPKGGTYYRGDKGVIMSPGDYCETVRLIPESAMTAFKRPKKTLPRIPKGNSHMDWVNGCKGGTPPCSNIVDHSGDLTELVLLGNIAIRTGKPIEWNAAQGLITNIPEANRFLDKNYRLY